MIAGLPGTGLGGIFYILAALFVLAREGVRRLRHDPRRIPPRVLAQLALMTFGILLVLWGTYWLLGQVLGTQTISSDISADSANAAAAPFGLALHPLALPPIFIATLPVQLATIALLLGLVEAARWSLKRRRRAAPLRPPELAPPPQISPLDLVLPVHAETAVPLPRHHNQP